MSEKIYYLGSSVRLRVEWRDVDKSLLTPDNQEWKLYDGENVCVKTLTESDLDLASEGVYFYDYTTLLDEENPENPGVWRLVALAKKGFVDTGGRIGVCKKTFQVSEA